MALFEQDCAWKQDRVWKILKDGCASFCGQLEILELRVGLGTATYAAKCLLGDAHVRAVGYWDSSAELAGMLRHVHGHAFENVHLGPVDGDLTRTPLSAIPDSHVIVAGPWQRNPGHMFSGKQ